MVWPNQDVIQKIDTPVGVSLSLTRDRGSGDLYVFLWSFSATRFDDSVPLDRDEFDAFSEAVKSIGTSLMQTAPAAKPGFWRVLIRVFTGEVIQRIDTSAGDDVVMSLRLKRERATNDYYVVLVGTVSGTPNYYTLGRNEFEAFSQAVESMRHWLMQTAPHANRTLS
jgi:hypothetical protein